MGLLQQLGSISGSAIKKTEATCLGPYLFFIDLLEQFA